MGQGFANYMRALQDLEQPIWREVSEKIRSYSPSVVGITAKSQNFRSACNVASLVKMQNRDCLVIMGGPHPSMQPDDVVRNMNVDICVYGEGEQTILDILHTFEKGDPLHGIKGIAFRDNGTPRMNDARPLLADLDQLCFAHEHAPETLWDYEQYPPSAFMSLFATRGCPFNCFFCGSREIWGRKVRFRSAQNVVREVQGLMKMGLKDVHFDDDTFGVSKPYILELCSRLRQDCPGLRWSSEIHVKLVDDSVIRAMKAAGCWYLHVGVESGNNRILELMRKGITVEEAYRACATIKNHGLMVFAFFMVGFPYETEATLSDTCEAIINFPADVITYSIFIPYPGTEAFRYCQQQGMIGDDYDISLFNHQSPNAYFCPGIPREVFREKLRKVELLVERKNRRARIIKMLSPYAFRKIYR